ncbi:MAG: histidine--tRNA ligase [bacterium]
MNYQTPRGTGDFFGDEIRKLRKAESVFAQVLSLYGFEEIKTPVFEDTALFKRSIGEGSDIVKKQMYTFLDKSGRSLSLRPEGTAPVARAVISGNLLTGLPRRFYYSGAMFRYERPQKDRRREFFQVGAEIFGEKSITADVEAIEICAEVFEKLKIPFSLEINSIGCSGCRGEYERVFKKWLEERITRFCSDCQERLSTNPLRVLDCKKEPCRKKLESAPLFKEFLCSTCRENFEAICGNLSKKKIGYKINPRLVRGLDYYNGCVFEFYSPSARDAIAAGGRYDGLVKFLGGPDVPAVGFAVGIDRVLNALEIKTERKGYIVIGAGIAVGALEDIAGNIRDKGKACIVSPKKKMNSSLKFASERNLRYAVLVGESELNSSSITKKDLETGEQETVLLEKFFKEL